MGFVILRGRAVAGGKGRGEALASRQSLSFLGGLDPETGEVRDAESDLKGQRIGGKVLAFRGGKGSTVGSYVLYAACRRGVGPVAVVCEKAETIVAVGAVLAGIPLVDSVDLHALETGDGVVVDGDAGAVDLPAIHEEPVASAFLRRGDRFLFLHRGPNAPTHPGKWQGVSGFVEGDEDPADRARKEIEEETRLEAILVARGEPFLVRSGPRCFRIHPFLFDCPRGEARLNFENTEARWLTIMDLENLSTVPRLRDAITAAINGAQVYSKSFGI